jgi:hypothetical protein
MTILVTDQHATVRFKTVRVEGFTGAKDRHTSSSAIEWNTLIDQDMFRR